MAYLVTHQARGSKRREVIIDTFDEGKSGELYENTREKMSLGAIDGDVFWELDGMPLAHTSDREFEAAKRWREKNGREG